MPHLVAGVLHALGHGNGHAEDQVIGLERVFPVGGAGGGLEELGQLHFTFALRSLHLGLGAQGDETRSQRGRIDDDALVPLGEDRVVAIFAVQGKALVAALQQADGRLVPEVPAAVALAEVAAERAHVADLGAADHTGRRRQGRAAFADGRVGGDIGQLDARADLDLQRRAAAGLDL